MYLSSHKVILQVFMITASQRSCGKVMFAVLSFCSREGSPLYRPPLATPAPGMFKLDQLGSYFTEATITPPPPHPDMFKLVHYEALMVGKRAADILLKCFLVDVKVRSHFSCGSHFVQLKWTLDNQIAFRFAHRRSWIKSYSLLKISLIDHREHNG